MTETTMTCERFDALLPDFLDGALAEPERLAAERHRDACPRCLALVAELEGVVSQAHALPVLRPSRDLWADIEQRIATPVVGIGHQPSTVQARRAPSRWWLAAAAVLLVATTAGVTFQVTTRMQRTTVATDGARQAPDSVTTQPRRVAVIDPAPFGAPPVADVEGGPSGGESRAPTPERREPAAERRKPAVERRAPSTESRARQLAPRPPRAPSAFSNVAATVEAPASPIERAYAKELGELATMVRERQGELDPATVAVLEHSLKVIDQAIDRSREALRQDPASGFLQEQLNHALDKKVGLLRTAARIPTRT